MIIPNLPAAALTDAQAGLSVSTSNVLLSLVPTTTNGGVGEVPAFISDPDHSSTYTSNGAGDLSVSYGAVADISYIAVSGHTATTNGVAVVQLLDGTALVDAVQLIRNNNVMFTFTKRGFADLTIKFVTTQANSLVTVSYIAAGEYMAITKGEQGGYSRAWLDRHLTQQSSSNFNSAPTAVTQKRKALKVSLSLPNQWITFAEDTWQSFIDFSFTQPFFIKEAVSKPQSSYVCYNPKSQVKAHSSTRKLDAISLKFDAYNGL